MKKMRKQTKPLNLFVPVTNRPIEYIQATDAEDFLDRYKQLQEALGCFQLVDIGDIYEGSTEDLLLLLSHTLSRMNRDFEALLERPYAVEIGGEKAIRALGEARQQRKARKREKRRG
jgi:hypothetical protein